jgi:superfamily II DNA or RNA helicase
LEKTKGLSEKQVVPLQDFIKLSTELEKECRYYQHCIYQCAVAGISDSQKEQARVIEMPTGSGKTWVQALIAKYYLAKGKKVTIIEPNS